MPRRRYSRLSSPVAWTIVMFCFVASPNVERICRLQSVQNAAAGLVTGIRRLSISLLCSASYTGFQGGSASCSRTQRLSTTACPVMFRATWSTTDNWSPTYVSDKCVLLTLERLLSTGRPTVSETGPSQLLEPECGTVYRQT